MSEQGGPQTLPFRYDRSDFIALAELGRRPIIRWLFLLAWALFALAAVLMAVCLIAGYSRVLWYIPPLLLLLAAYLLLHRYGAHLGAWTLNRIAKRDDLLREQIMTVRDDCFRAESSRGKTEIRWSAVPRIHVGDARIFIYSTRRQAFIIPQRAFANRDDFLSFVAAAKHRWGQHHRL